MELRESREGEGKAIYILSWLWFINSTYTLRRITHKKCYLLLYISPHKSDKQSHQYKVDYNIKCSVVPTYSWQILNNDKSLYLNRYPWPKMFLCNRFLKLCDIISYMKCNNFFASKSHHHILAKNLLWKIVPTLACCNH